MSNVEMPKLETMAMPNTSGKAAESTLGPAPLNVWSLAQQQTLQALDCGALQSIQTNYEFVEQNGVRFLVRILANLARKEKATKKQQQMKIKGKEFNPFLPYEQDLFVCDLSPTHLCLLNKFNVVDHHILIVTRAFEHQEAPLNINDFVALWMGLREIDGLAFYNGGKTAGASQRHKHLQLIPMPLSPEGREIPMEAILTKNKGNELDSVIALPFQHGFAPLSLSSSDSPHEAANVLLHCYQRLLTQMENAQSLKRDRKPIPYNLLVTRRWMLLVPRIQEKAYSISINALGFAGSLFVKDQAQLDLLKEKGPMTLLQSVGCPVIL